MNQEADALQQARLEAERVLQQLGDIHNMTPLEDPTGKRETLDDALTQLEESNEQLRSQSSACNKYVSKYPDPLGETDFSPATRPGTPG